MTTFAEGDEVYHIDHTKPFQKGVVVTIEPIQIKVEWGFKYGSSYTWEYPNKLVKV